MKRPGQRAVRLAAVCTACALMSAVHAAAPEQSTSASANPFWTIQLNALTATRERPLFTPSRRPAMQTMPAVVMAPPAPPAPAVETAQLSLRLLGTIAGPDSGIAICLDPATNEVVRVRTGESVQGWTLRMVRGREATFEKAARQSVLALPSPDEAQSAPPQIAGTQPYAMSPVNAVPAQAAPVSGSWRDGDGNLIAPPSKK